MSPRPKRRRILTEPPGTLGFIPIGEDYIEENAVVLLFEEFESLKLSDFNGLTQEEAALKLGVSRPTFTRIYAAARQKVTTAMVENRPLVIKGGNVEFESNWYECMQCGSVFMVDKEKGQPQKCPVCSSENIVQIEKGEGMKMPAHGHFARQRGRGGKGFRNKTENCICPKCDFKIPHIPGNPCHSNLCPNCNIRLIKEGSPHHLFILKIRKTL